MEAGIRESQEGWRELLLSLKRRGLKDAPKLVIGDGVMGFWGAVSEAFPTTAIQRCWVDKTVNVLDMFPKKKQPEAKKMIHQIWMAESRKDAEDAFGAFERSLGSNTRKLGYV